MQERIGAWLDRYERWIFFACTLIAAISFLLLFYHHKELAEDTQDNALAIQQSRREFLEFECKDVNDRNLKAKATLEQYEFTAETRTFIYLFIDSTLPVRACDEFIEEYAPLPPTDNN